MINKAWFMKSSVSFCLEQDYCLGAYLLEVDNEKKEQMVKSGHSSSGVQIREPFNVSSKQISTV